MLPNNIALIHSRVCEIEGEEILGSASHNPTHKIRNAKSVAEQRSVFKGRAEGMEVSLQNEKKPILSN